MQKIHQLVTEAQLREIIVRFYDAVYVDPIIGSMFEGVGRQRQEQRLLGFMQMTAEPGSEPFDGPYLRDAHARLTLTDALFDHRHALLEAAIRACGHGDEVVAAFRAYDERWRVWVLAGEVSTDLSA